jgi:hypothetical protein
MDMFLLILWAIVGILTLCSKQVPKLSYAMVWVVLMTHLISNAIGA